jgi:hypothetical protein
MIAAVHIVVAPNLLRLRHEIVKHLDDVEQRVGVPALGSTHAKQRRRARIDVPVWPDLVATYAA